MLTIKFPGVLNFLRELDYGLLPFFTADRKQFFLAIKATKEIILTARTHNQFKVYLIANRLASQSHLGLTVAFFDDDDEPLVINALLFSNDGLLDDITAILSQKEFEIYFFDELNRELLGVRVENKDCDRFRTTIAAANFPTFEQSQAFTLFTQLQERFSTRTSDDDDNAFSIVLKERLYPDDFLILDVSDNLFSQHGANNTIPTTTLIREGDPGPMQEQDIARMLRRVFEPQSIYLNPFQTDKNTEITDILVVTDDTLLFIQAKDSPNTEDMLRRSIDRKRSTVQAHIKKACNQMRGAIAYTQSQDGFLFKFKVSGEIVTVPLTGQQIFGVIIVREMFDDDYFECSAPVLDLIHNTAQPIALLDYIQLHIITQHLTSPSHFINGLSQLVNAAIDNKQFPKSVWMGGTEKPI